MAYTVWYETDQHLRLTTIYRGGLTEFKKMIKKAGWKIRSIEFENKDGKVVRKELYVDNKRTVVYEY